MAHFSEPHGRRVGSPQRDTEVTVARAVTVTQAKPTAQRTSGTRRIELADGGRCEATERIGTDIMETSRSDTRIHLRAYYLWEADGRPEGRADEYWAKAQAMLEEESRLTAPIDEATSARGLLTAEKQPTGISQESSKATSNTSRSSSPKAPSTRRKKAAVNDGATPVPGPDGGATKRRTPTAGMKSAPEDTKKRSPKN